MGKRRLVQAEDGSYGIFDPTTNSVIELPSGAKAVKADDGSYGIFNNGKVEELDSFSMPSLAPAVEKKSPNQTIAPSVSSGTTSSTVSDSKKKVDKGFFESLFDSAYNLEQSVSSSLKSGILSAPAAISNLVAGIGDAILGEGGSSQFASNPYAGLTNTSFQKAEESFKPKLERKAPEENVMTPVFELAQKMQEGGELIQKSAKKSAGISDKDLDKGFVDLVTEGKVTDAFKVAGLGALQSLPTSMALAAAGPAAVFAGSTAVGTGAGIGEAYAKDKDVSSVDMLKSLGYGVFEGLSESIFQTDLNALRNIAKGIVTEAPETAIKSLIKEQGKDAVKQEIVRGYGGVLKNALKGAGEEGVEEIVSTIGSFLVDRVDDGKWNEKNFQKLAKDSVDAFVIGALSGGGVSGISALASKQDLTDEQKKKVEMFSEVANNQDLSEDVRNIAKQKAKEIIKYNADLSSSNYEEIADLPLEQRTQVFELLSRVKSAEEAKADIKDIDTQADIDKKIASLNDEVNNIIGANQQSKLEAQANELAALDAQDKDAVDSFINESGIQPIEIDKATDDDIIANATALQELQTKIDDSEQLTDNQKQSAKLIIDQRIQKLSEAKPELVNQAIGEESMVASNERISQAQPVASALANNVATVTNKNNQTQQYSVGTNENGEVVLKPKMRFSSVAQGATIPDTISIKQEDLGVQKISKDKDGKVESFTFKDERTGTEFTIPSTPQLEAKFNPASYSVSEDIETNQVSPLLNKITPAVKRVISQYTKALKATMPNMKVVLHDNAENMINSLVDQGYSREYATAQATNANGVYAKAGNTIHLNVNSMNESTFGHEIFHSVFIDMAKNNPQEFSEMRRRVTKLMKSKATQESLGKEALDSLNEFAAQYEDGDIAAEEFMAELAGVFAANPTLKFNKPLMQDLAKIVYDFLSKIAKKLNSDSIQALADTLFSEQVKTEQIASFIESFGKSLREGTKIEGANIFQTTKTQDNAVQEQTAGQVPVQPESAISREVAQGESQPETQVTTQEGQQQEEIKAQNKVVYPDVMKASREAAEANKKFNAKETLRWLAKITYDRMINARVALEDANMVYSLYSMYNKSGASMFGNLKFTKLYNEIFEPLTTEERKLLDNFVFLRRVIAIDSNFDNRNEPRPKHPIHNELVNGVATDKKLATNKESAEKTLSEYKSLIGDEQYNKIMNHADKYFSAFKDILKDKLDAGLIDQATYDLYENYEYSPRKFLKFLFDYNDISSDQFMYSGAPITKEELKKIKDGSDEEIQIDSAKLLHAAMIATQVRIANNEALKTLYNESLGNTLPFIREANYKRDASGNIRRDVNGNPLFSNEADEGFQVVGFKENGVYKPFQLKQDFLKEYFDRESWDKSSKAYKLLQKATLSNVLRNFATGINLGFVLSNIPIDAISQVQLTDLYKGTPFGVAGQYAKQLNGSMSLIPSLLKYETEIGKKNAKIDDLIFEYAKAGGLMMTMTNDYDPKETSKIGKVAHKYLGALGNASEMASKLTAYQSVRDQLIKDWKKANPGQIVTEDQMRNIRTEAAYKARAAMDYARGGLAVKYIDGFIPYLNVLTQATFITAKYIKDHPVEFSNKIAQAGIALMAITAYNMAVAGDDYDNDDVQNDLMNKIVIFNPVKNEDGTRDYYTISAPPVVKGVLNVFQNIAEGLYLRGTNQPEVKLEKWKEKAYDKLLGLASVNISTNQPPLIKAIYEYRNNTDLWSKRDITPDFNKTLSGYEGATSERVPVAFKTLGKATGLSPARLHKAFGDIFVESNPLVGLGIGLADNVINSVSKVPDIEKSKYLKEGFSKGVAYGFINKIAGRVYKSTNPDTEFQKPDEVADLVSKQEYTKINEVKANMKMLVKNKASIAETNKYLESIGEDYRKAALSYRETATKRSLLKYPNMLDDYADIAFASNSVAKAKILYMKFPYLANPGNQDLKNDLHLMGVDSKDVMEKYSKYVRLGGIPKEDKVSPSVD